MLRFFLLGGLLYLFVGLASAQTDELPYLYKVTTVRAAPSELLDLINLYKEQMEFYVANGDHAPFWMRHSQGDQWDIMLLFPMDSYEAYYHPDRIESREGIGGDVQNQLNKLIAFQEDLFTYGPPLEVVQEAFDGAGFFHVEMFEALPGMHEELYEQRIMENEYLRHLRRPQNLIFVKSQGASVDVFTLGFYRDIKHFAASADIPLDEEDAAAKAAGFDSVYSIGPYLRSLIREHHDTLAVAIR